VSAVSRRGMAQALVWVLLLGGAVARAEVLDAIVARVDARVVTWSEVLQEQALRRVESAEADAPQGAETVLAGLVRRRLLLAEAEKLRLPEEPGAAPREMTVLVEARGEGVWKELLRYGVTRDAMEERARQRRVVEQYLALRREMTFVPEAEIRTFYGRQGEAFGGKSLAEVRDEVRTHLADKSFQRELDQWVDRQMSEGRVSINPLPEQ